MELHQRNPSRSFLVLGGLLFILPLFSRTFLSAIMSAKISDRDGFSFRVILK